MTPFRDDYHRRRNDKQVKLNAVFDDRVSLVYYYPAMKPDIIDSLDVAFREKGAGNTEMPPKPGIHPGGDDNFIHAMPAYIPALKSAGIKWVSAFVDNPAKGLPYISGLVILNDAGTGLPLAVMDGVWMTGPTTHVFDGTLTRAFSQLGTPP